MPKIVDIGLKRAEFVSASLDVIATEGLAAATLRRIAAHAGATTGAITHYFDGRDALLLEAVRSAHYAAGARMQKAAARGSTAADRLEAVILEALPLDAVRMREWRVWSAFRGTLAGDSNLWALNEMGYGAWRTFLETLLAAPGLGAEEVRRESALLIALIDGFGFRLAAMTGSAEQVAAEQRRVTADIRAYLKAVGERLGRLGSQ